MRLIMAFTAVAALACAGNPAPVPVEASPAGHKLLEGTWVGTYEGERADRYGSIVFTLDATADTARGDVLMLPDDQPNGRRGDPGEIAATAPKPPTVLSIRFVRVRGNEVTGTLDPYLSPDCACVVVSIFTGFIDRNRISGTYVTEGQFARVAEGRWQVERKIRDR